MPNPVFRGEIRERAKAPLTVPVDERVCNLITIGRLEREKRYDRLLDIAAELKKRGFAFRWYFAGSGPLYEDIRRRRDALGLGPCVTLTGYMETRVPCSRGAMRSCSFRSMRARRSPSTRPKRSACRSSPTTSAE